MDNLMFSLNATVPVFLVMVIGYILKNLRILDQPFIKTLNTFNFKITLPVLVFKDIANSDFKTVWDAKYVIFCFLVTLLSIVLIWIISSKAYQKQDFIGEFVQGAYRSSAAVLGIAFIQNIYGTSGMAPLMIIGTVPLYNIAAVLILSFTGPDAHGFDKQSFGKSIKDILANPIIWGIAAGTAASFFNLDFPVMIDKTVNNIAVLATPLALIGLGAGFEGRKALAMIKPTAICTLIKLILLPVIFLPIAVYMGFTGEKLVALVIMLGAPTTVSSYIMAKNMGHEGILTSSVVVATTFLSSVTLTAFLFFLKSMGLI